ncbi:ABC transporter substrate-binding protein [Konateibacter massiliensis]|uniref:ABC transporter substrate-binding protein n=1 Tax=Konateibacter massiliensis TaxID=2002841 RepID=UPI0015D4C82C|nr:ABC transporter substrate-binding protein [Konateibacter massiliensis]
MKKFISLLTIATLSISLIGCGAGNSNGEDNVSQDSSSNVESGSSEEGYPVTITSYSVSSDGSTWEKIEETFEASPERVVCNNQGTAELMLRLGLADKIIGIAAVYGEPAEDIAEEFNKLNVISADYASKELVLGADPDCVIGRGDLFIDGDYGIGTVTDLNAIGISTYITEVGADGANFESLISDIENLGKIFHVQDKAAELAAEYQSLVDSLKNDARWSKKELKMAEIAVVEDGIPTVSASQTEYFQNEAFEMIGLPNVFKDFAGSEVSVETLIETNPDVLILFDYEGGPDMDTMINSLYENESLQNITAIQEKQIYALDFNEIYGGSGEIYSAMQELGSLIYGE